MFLNNQTVICIKSNPVTNTWDYFNEKTELINLPKRTIILNQAEDILRSLFEPLVEPKSREPQNATIRHNIRKWATHMAALEQFVLLGKTDWMFICEDHIDINSLNVLIETPGLTLHDPDASAYLIDRQTAQTVLNNIKIYYTPLQDMYQDLFKLNLIKLNQGFYFPHIKYPFLLDFLPFFFIFLFFIACLFIVFSQPHLLVHIPTSQNMLHFTIKT